MFIQRRAKKKQLLYLHPSLMLVFGRGRGFRGELSEERERGEGGGLGRIVREDSKGVVPYPYCRQCFMTYFVDLRSQT